MKRPDSLDEHLGDVDLLSRVRASVVRKTKELGYGELCDEAELVVSELVTNALLHAGGCTGVSIKDIPGGVRRGA